MNRFKETLDDLRKRALKDQELSEALKELGGEQPSQGGSKEQTKLKLPYSSDPEPSGEPWH